MTQALTDRLAPDSSALPVESVAEAYLALLKQRGIDYFYVGAGTDTASIVEAYARAETSGLDYPVPVVCTHENLAVGMAHGYYMVSRKPQAVMLHVSVGAANAVCGLINAARAQTPMLFTAGRTPLFESGRLGARNGEIHWAQEMFDQGSMVREWVKWDYELRDGLNVEQIVDRALGISMSEPRGPVYLTLPREVLAQGMTDFAPGTAPALPAAPAPDPQALRQLATALAGARHPVIVCTASGADPCTVAMLRRVAERFAIGVAETKPRFVNFPSTHPLHQGYDLAKVFPEADVLLFLESDVPWLPRKFNPRPDSFVAHAGTDPLFNRYPVRSFRSDLSLTSSVALLLPALERTLEAAGAVDSAPARRSRLLKTALVTREDAGRQIRRDAEQGGAITKLFLTRCLDEVRPADAIVVNEYSAMREHMRFDEPGTFFMHPSAGGLGWGLPAALGAQQAAPGRPVIAVVGDGSYLFANPAVCHHAAAMHGLPILIVLFNNARWDAVYRSALTLYPDTHTARYAERHKTGPLSSLAPVPDFEKYAEACGGWTERVTEREQLVPALRRALRVVRDEKRQALLNIVAA